MKVGRGVNKQEDAALLRLQEESISQNHERENKGINHKICKGISGDRSVRAAQRKVMEKLLPSRKIFLSISEGMAETLSSSHHFRGTGIAV